MNILITGGTGFVGLSLIPLLLKDGHKVAVLCRDEVKARKLLGETVKILIGDVTEMSSITGCCDGIDVVYHMVAKVGNELPSEEALSAFRKVNVEGTRNIIRESQRSGVSKFIYISSIAAMGIVRNGVITEESPCEPYLPYQISKREAELLILEEFLKNDFPALIIRPAKVYGYGEREYSYLKLVKLCKKGIFPKVGLGKNLVSHLYITDLVEALRILVDRGVSGQIYTLASEESIGFAESAEVIAEELGTKIHYIYIPSFLMISIACVIEHVFVALGKVPPVTKRNVEATITDRVYDLSKPKKDFGFSPRVSMKEGIRKVVAYYKDKNLV